VAPEVSQLDPADGVTIQGFQVPALTIRRAATMVELRDGESFAIAGLFQRGYSNTINQVPGAGDIPILGALFRSSDWKRNESELVIIVTPHLTTPVKRVEDLPNPLTASAESSAIDVILDGKSHDKLPPNPNGDMLPTPAPAASSSEPTLPATAQVTPPAAPPASPVAAAGAPAGPSAPPPSAVVATAPPTGAIATANPDPTPPAPVKP